MKIRKYVARNMPEALQQVRDDLGESAVILSSRQIRKNNRFNLHDEARVEVTAAFDDVQKEAAVPRRAPDRSAHSGTVSLATQRYAAQGGNTIEGEPMPAVPEPVASPRIASPVSSPPEPPQKAVGGGELEPLIRQLQQLQETVVRLERSRRGGVVLPEALGRLAERLENVGVARQLIDELIQQLFEELGAKALEDRTRVGEKGVNLLVRKMPECRDIRIGRRRKVVGFFGASGAGKTTAAAKIAAGFAMKRGDSILLISCDDRRVGALEQMRAFSQIIGVPLETAYDEEDVLAVLQRYKEAKLVLIDPAGCGPQDHQERERQARLFTAAGVDEVQVVIDGKSSLEHMLDQIEASDLFDERRLLFTKMDEVSRAGAVLSAAAKMQVATSYFVVGNAVPGDIEAGNLGRLAGKVMGISMVSGKRRG